MSPQLLSDDRLSQPGQAGAGVVAPGPGPAFPGLEPSPRRVPYRFGWSIAVVSMANVLLAVIAYAAGMQTAGVVACSALSLASVALVLAEVAHRRELALDGTVRPRRRIDREPFFRPW